MSEPATPEERAQHAVRLKMADDKWAALVADEHYEDAADIHKWYWTVGFTHGLREAQAEIDKLREAICRLADQDATLSVCDGNVTVTMDATLTDAEREALSRIYDLLNERSRELQAARRIEESTPFVQLAKTVQLMWERLR